MLIRYIIDSSFEFCPESCQLTVFGAENIVITLNAPASRCLELLLERRFELVLQSEFYEYAWGDEAKSVSVNTLYQNIALLRKALKSISKNYESMILTIPRQGFSFNQIFSVRELACEELAMPQKNSDITRDTLIDLTSVSEKDDNYPLSFWWQGKNKKFIKPLSYGATALIFIIILSMANFFLEPRKLSPLSNYILYSNNSGCKIYTKSKSLDIAKKIEIIKALGVDCQTSPYLYISVFRYSIRTSAVACTHPIDSIPSPACTTFNLIGGRSNEK